MEFIPLNYGENLDIHPDLFNNGGQITRIFQFWRRNGDGSTRFMDDRLKIWYFAPDLWIFG